MESLLEGHELLVDTHLEVPLDVEGNIFALVLIGDRNVLSVWLEVIVGDATKLIVLHTEGHVKHTINIILPENKRRENENENSSHLTLDIHL